MGRSTDDCSDACARLDAAGCGDVGSQCVAQCLGGPTPSVTASLGDCAKLETAYFDCFWAAAAYVCDETLRSVPVGCDDERAAVSSCETGGAAGAGGVGGAAGAGGAGDAVAGSAGTGDALAGAGAGGAR